MGLCCCTFLTPVGACLGCSSWCCAKNLDSEKIGQFRYFAAALLVIGIFGLYLPLTVLCARVQGASWEIYPTDGECWSEGSGVYANLGVAAGLCIGAGATGFIVTQILYRNQSARSLDSEAPNESTQFTKV